MLARKQPTNAVVQLKLPGIG